MQAVKLTDKVWWVGAIDWGIRDFHGYATSRGTTYNAYLILADKVTLIDTVKAPFKDEMMRRIASVVDPKTISYIISNHTEMDHSGCLPEIIQETNPEKIFASKMGVQGLGQHFSFDRDLTEVANGESLSLGDMKITFHETRMLHWPDSMISYLHEEKILFSQDAFGMHLASTERFDDEHPAPLLKYEAMKYYANILTPFSQMVTTQLKKLVDLNLPLAMIAPDHGPIWRNNTTDIIGHYLTWAEQKPTKKAVIAFDTMWQSTAQMANAICDGLSQTGISAKVMPMHSSHRSDIATELLECGGYIVGSPTINNQMFPTVADLLCYTKGLKFKNLVGGTFGSSGWSGEATKHITAELETMKIDIVCEAVTSKYRPTSEVLNQCVGMGKTVGEKIKEL